MTEKILEKNLREGVKKRGGMALKFASPFFTGMPDRIVLLPGGRILFAEMKSPGKKPTPRQNLVIDMLRKLGFTVWIIDNEQILSNFLKTIEMMYESHVGDNGIYTKGGDYIGSIEDEDLRENAISGLNGEVIEDWQKEILEEVEKYNLDEGDLSKLLELHDVVLEAVDPKEYVKDLVAKEEKHDAVLEKLEELKLDIEFFRDVIATDSQYDLVQELVEKIRAIGEPIKPKKVKPKKAKSR